MDFKYQYLEEIHDVEGKNSPDGAVCNTLLASLGCMGCCYCDVPVNLYFYDLAQVDEENRIGRLLFTE